MNTHAAFTTKAEKYAKYRWNYVPEAIEALFRIAGLSQSSTVADIGAGTGILTRHFIGRVRRVYAVEPNAEMRRQAARYLPYEPGCAILAGSAEQIPLASHSVDLVTVAQAIHWFDPEPTRQEFARVLRPGGWLALLRNHATEEPISTALGAIITPEYGVTLEKGAPEAFRRPYSFYFGSDDFQKLVFPFVFQQDWESFIGSQVSTSIIPDDDHPAYHRFEQAAREIFDRFSQDGRITAHGETELMIGRPSSNEDNEYGY